MSKVLEYLRASSVEEAIALEAAHPGAAFLAGGSFLLAGDHREKPATVVDVGRVLSRAIERKGNSLSIGAGATFQDLADSKVVPAALRKAALSMVNRNVRNVATVGGNIAASKSCASLLPVFLVLGARARVAGPSGEHKSLVAEWMATPRGLLLDVELELAPGAKCAFVRYARTACDVSVLTAAVAWLPGEDGKLECLRVAMGGLGPHAREFPDLASLFEDKPLSTREEIERASLAVFAPRSDFRGSAEFKAIRAAALLADALHEAEDLA